MDDEADIGFVDAHTEGVGGHHHRLSVVEKILLIFASLRVRQSRVIPGGGIAVVTEHLADVLHLFPGGAVDDAALPLPGRQKPQQLLILEFRLYDLKVEIRAVKPRHNPEGIF